MKRFHKSPAWILCIITAVLISCAHGVMTKQWTLKQDLYFCEGSLHSSRSSDEVKKTVLRVNSAIDGNTRYQQIDILAPYDGAVFPGDIASPVFRWENWPQGINTWLVIIRFEGSSNSIYVLTDTPEWRPEANAWEIIKEQSLEKQAFITVAGIDEGARLEVLTTGHITISTSKDEVESPVLYQQMPLPFAAAKQNPTHSVWRLGQVSSYEEPPVIMKNLPVCGNCHCISKQGTLFGMDMDINGDKGAYTVAGIKENMELSRDDFISWNDYNRADKIQSMGLFSRISPDDTYIVSTVKEKSFFSMIPDINFSQFFFPIQGIIAWYSVDEKQFHALPGADNPEYVQTCPEWSHDGKYIVFARAKTDHRLDDIIGDKGYFNIEPGERIHDLNKKYQIRFDLYRVPFNKGKGGTPEPVVGASNNGMSNYFPRCSPDGRWIVFTQSPTG
ncbi:MAG: PD40 domain-containing protein, partial [Deltaproteobacteria bacterium]|nr:PD40 domain-containing protein [Deltaproteobacteria bacterium]